MRLAWVPSKTNSGGLAGDPFWDADAGDIASDMVVRSNAVPIFQEGTRSKNDSKVRMNNAERVIIDRFACVGGLGS